MMHQRSSEVGGHGSPSCGAALAALVLALSMGRGLGSQGKKYMVDIGLIIWTISENHEKKTEQNMVDSGRIMASDVIKHGWKMHYALI